MAKFNVGDIVIVHPLNTSNWQQELLSLIGCEVEIISLDVSDSGIPQFLYQYAISTVGTGVEKITRTKHGLGTLYVMECDLRKKRPPQEFEAGSWDECIWKPKEMKHAIH